VDTLELLTVAVVPTVVGKNKCRKKYDAAAAASTPAGVMYFVCWEIIGATLLET
jgi:hypothetical protein